MTSWFRELTRCAGPTRAHFHFHPLLNSAVQQRKTHRQGTSSRDFHRLAQHPVAPPCAHALESTAHTEYTEVSTVTKEPQPYSACSIATRACQIFNTLCFGEAKPVVLQARRAGAIITHAITMTPWDMNALSRNMVVRSTVEGRAVADERTEQNLNNQTALRGVRHAPAILA